jgi:hypothetical protein
MMPYLYDASNDIKIDVFGKNTATNLAKKVKSFKCIFITWYQILYRINLVSKSLQDKAVNMQTATDLISQVKNYFIELRSDKGFEEILVDAKDLADTLEVESEFQQSTRIRPRRVKRQFNYESEDHLVVEPNQEFKINFFFFILDKSINSLDERFEQLRNHNIFHFRYNINGEINSKNLFKKCQYFQLSLTDGNHRDVFFFYICHSRFLPYGFYGTFRSAAYQFLLLISYAYPCFRWCDGGRGTFPDHPRPFHLTFTDIHNNIYTPMGALPDGTRTRADVAVVVERVLNLPSTTLPSAPRRHTHTSMARRRFFPWKKSSPFGGIRTH